MFSVSTDSILQFLVDKFLDRKTPPEYVSGMVYERPGLYFEIPLEVSDYTDKGSKRIYTKGHIVFAGHTSVWYYVEPYNHIGYDHSQRVWGNYKNSSNHDSCWRSDGLQWLTQTYFEMCEMCNPDKAPINLESTNSWIMWSRMDHCMVQYRQKDGLNAYGYDLIDVKEFKNVGN